MADPMNDDLVGRLEAADEGCFAFDREIALLFGGYATVDSFGDCLMIDGDRYPDHPGAIIPSPTQSLDDALALAERVLPGHAMNVCKDTGPPDGPPFRWSSVIARHSLAGPVGRPGWWFGVSDTPALALCIAILKARPSAGTGSHEGEGR